jgi:glycerol-3-phosphate acyltransferase PlsY
MLQIIFAIIISYLIGSIPTAYIFGRVIKNTDIRQFGSGNVGATNALRLLGKRWGVTVLILDILKGALPVIFLGELLKARSAINPEFAYLMIGVSCICGHNWTLFLKFKGGKGVATTFGVLIGLSMRIPGLNIALSLTVIVWLVTFLLSKVISLASLVAAVSFPLLTLILNQSLVIIIAGVILSVFIIIRHKANLQRILQGKEPRLNLGKK